MQADEALGRKTTFFSNALYIFFHKHTLPNKRSFYLPLKRQPQTQAIVNDIDAVIKFQFYAVYLAANTAIGKYGNIANGKIFLSFAISGLYSIGS